MGAYHEGKLRKFMDHLGLARPLLGECCQQIFHLILLSRYRVQLAASALHAGEGVIWVGQLAPTFLLNFNCRKGHLNTPLWRVSIPCLPPKSSLDSFRELN
jgi:hypothetical protein